MSEQAAQEPTMEEILASIRRIISEDDAPAADAAPAAVHAAPEPAAEEEVLELTDRYEEAAPAPAAVAPRPAPAPQSIGDIDAFEAPRQAAPPPPAPEPRPEPRYEAPAFEAYADEPLVSPHVADRAASAFDGLAHSLLMPASGRSLEDVVKELLKPILRDWLDQNLTGIVETQVRAVAEDFARRQRR
jgi:cell pole-organizing protein PopZ